MVLEKLLVLHVIWYFISLPVARAKNSIARSHLRTTEFESLNVRSEDVHLHKLSEW